MAEKVGPDSTGTVIIVPARLGSTRLPAKPLADIAGIPLIVRVMNGLSESAADLIIVATDSEEIASVVRNAGFSAVITGEASSGTERVFNAWDRLGRPGQRIINVQGDEPAVRPGWINALVEVERAPDLVTTLARSITPEEAADPSAVNVILNRKNEAMYFSRFPVPFGGEQHLLHIGVYCFSPESLCACIGAGQTAVSKSERLEQLAWLENGIRIRVIEGDFHGYGIDTPEDLGRAREMYRSEH